MILIKLQISSIMSTRTRSLNAVFFNQNIETFVESKSYLAAFRQWRRFFLFFSDNRQTFEKLRWE